MWGAGTAEKRVLGSDPGPVCCADGNDRCLMPIMRSMVVYNLLRMAATVAHGLRLMLALSGGGGALWLRTGNPIGGASPGPNGFGFSPTPCNNHTSWNLGVGMELAGDTKPTIASRVFAAPSKFWPGRPTAAGHSYHPELGCTGGPFRV